MLSRLIVIKIATTSEIIDMNYSDISTFVFDRVEVAWRRGLGTALYAAWNILLWLIRFSYRHYIIMSVVLLYVAPEFVLAVLNFLFELRLGVKFPRFSTPTPVPVEPLPKDLNEYVWRIAAVFFACTTIILVLRPRKVVRLCEHGFMVERSVDGSVPVQSPPPDLQGEVWTVSNGKRLRQGVFFRVSDRLYLAEHCILGADKVFLVYKGKEQELVDRPTIVDFDFVSVPYEPFSHWQMASGKFPKRSSATFASVHNGTVCTYGLVKPGSTVGYVDYSGTTLPGFSGAPYLLGKIVVGVHLGSGTTNMGLDGASISVLVAGRVTPEGGSAITTDLTEIYDNQHHDDPISWRFMANEMYQVKVKGQFRLYDEDEFKKLQRKHELKFGTQIPKYEGDSAEAKFTFQDQENCLRPAVPVMQAAGPCSTSQLDAVRPPKPLTLEQTILNRLDMLEKKITAGPAPTPVQPKPVSPSISEEVLSLVSELQKLNVGLKTFHKAKQRLMRSASQEELSTK